MNLQILSIVLGLAAAGLWVFSACVKTPKVFAKPVSKQDVEAAGGTPLGGVYAFNQHLQDLVKALQRQSRLSRWAAVLTAAAVTFQAIALAIQISISQR